MDVDPHAALLLPCLTGAGLVALAALVARTGWEHTHNRLFAALYMLSGLKSVLDGLLAQTPGVWDAATSTWSQPPASWAQRFHAQAPLFPDEAWVVHLNVACAAVMVPLLFAFVTRFPRPASWAQRRRWLQAAPFALTPLLLAMYVARPGWVVPHGGLIPAWALALSLVATAVTLAATAILARTRLRSEGLDRKQAGYVLFGLVPAFAVTWAVTALQLRLNAGADGGLQQQVVWITAYVSPVLELLAAAAVAYAILKYRLLSCELRVKGGVKYIAMTVTLTGLLFLAGHTFESRVLESGFFAFLGPTAAALVSAAAMVVLFRPVERACEALSDRLFPEAARSDHSGRRAREIYLAQVTAVLRDGDVTPREWAFLRRLRAQLAIPELEARRLEERAERAAGVDHPGTGLEPGHAFPRRAGEEGGQAMPPLRTGPHR